MDFFFQWPWFNQKVYMVYRVVLGISMVTWIVADFYYESQMFYKHKKWIYLVYATNWSFILLGITTVFQAVCVLFYCKRSSFCIDHQSFERMPPSLKVLWMLQNLSYCSAIVVSISYWSFIAFLEDENVLQSDMSRLKHTLNSLYVILEILISATPFRILHLFFTVMLGSIYSLFNAIYFLNDGTILEGRHYAYNVLNWLNPAEAIITCLICIVQAIVSQTLLYYIYRLRIWIYLTKYFKKQMVEYDEFESEMRGIMTGSTSYTTEST
ncbi:hypothetical protein FSP39_009019 [Pinctada imbricata]|uniref:Protein rolling stone n=1 Tax=Pinctada imbricata TaxID=66713 RepID=A0AA88YLR4_PINIB|nr:hypothetical protein FSP39_009019 [Pinctada imbricata]